MVRIPGFPCHDPGSIPGQGTEIPQASINIQFSSVQSLSHVRLFATPWIAARQASLSLTISRSSPKFTPIELPSNHLTLCCPLLLPSISPSIRVFSNESALRIRGPKYQSLSFSISWAQLQKPKCLSDSKPLFCPAAFPKVLSGRSAFHWLNNPSESSLSRAGSLKM